MVGTEGATGHGGEVGKDGGGVVQVADELGTVTETAEGLGSTTGQ